MRRNEDMLTDPYKSPSTWNSLSQRVRHGTKNGPNWILTANLNPDARVCSNWPLLGTAALVPETTGSEASLQNLDEWLNRCRQQHKLCETGKSYTPRRVLDLGDLHLPPAVRLHEPSPGEELNYLCLSYRWSSIPTLQTLKSNMEEHKLAIPWDRLPLAFQQLCSVARRLRLRYVWIDALCIVQDDTHDKAVDIAVMASIFEAAELTIVSAWADGPEQGVFSDLGDFSHRKFTATTEDGVTQPVYVRRRLPHFQHGRLPCLQRGWMYQELFLSPRIVFFLRNEIAWQCQDHTECQCSPSQEVRVWEPGMQTNTFELTRVYEKLRILNGVRRVIQAQQTFSPSDAAAYWWSHIYQYTRCQLSEPTDKLPAIQGLATRMAPELRLGSYIAGMWEKSLIFDLGWWSSPRGTRPAAWRAPTWSWASIDGKVNNDVHAKWWTPLATITRITTTPEPRGATEALHSGRLTLDCHVHEAWLSMTGWDTGEPEEWGPLNQYSLFFSRLDAASHLHALDFSRSDAGRRLNSVELGSLHGDKHMNSLEFDADCDLRRQPLESMDNPETTTSVATTGTSGKTPVSRDDENKDGRFWCAKILRNQRGNDLGGLEEIWLVMQKVKGDEYRRVGCLGNGRQFPFKGVDKGWERKTIHLI